VGVFAIFSKQQNKQHSGGVPAVLQQELGPFLYIIISIGVRDMAGQLRLALEDILSQPGAVKPSKVRFFRVQMQTIISRALEELDIKPVQSRRCFSLIGTHPDL
jgi:RNA-binding protein Tab2/Atab2